MHRGRVKTQGRVITVSASGVKWWSNETGLAVRSDPDPLREDGYEWNDAPLVDYVVKHPFPYEGYPEVEPEEIDLEGAEDAAVWHAERGDTVRARAIFEAVGNEEAAKYCANMQPRWK